jgi:hypothetical protein
VFLLNGARLFSLMLTNIRKMKIVYYFTLILLIFVSSSCKKESTEGIYFTESSTLSAFISLSKDVEHDGYISSEITVKISDAQGGDYHKIKNGSVKVNGTEMVFGNIKYSDGSTSQGYYVNDLIGEVKVQANMQYDFEIKLSDGTIFKSDIISQEDIDELNVPVKHDRNSDMKISWKGTTKFEHLQILILGYSENQFLFQSGVWVIDDESTQISGELTIPNEEFENPSLDSVVVEMLSAKENYGMQKPALRSYLTSLFWIRKGCKIY